MAVAKNLIAVLLSFSSIWSYAQQDVELFNQGRTRCYFGGMSWAEEGRALFHTHNYVTDTTTGILNKIALTAWQNDGWKDAVFQDFIPGYSESYPVWQPGKNRLYFSSSAPLPGKKEPHDLNIWYTDRIKNVWTKPVPLSGLNSEKNDMLSFIDEDEKFYILRNDTPGENDIYVCSSTQDGFTALTPVTNWNSTLSEEFVSVYPRLNIAFIQRSAPGQTTEIFVSQWTENEWSVPVAFNYENKTTQIPYVQRWPMLSPDLGTFSFVSQGLIWQQNAASVLKRNGIELRKKYQYKPLPIKARTFGEPEVFGGLTLKTNNGISFTKDQKTVYLSRYTEQRDSLGRQHIKLFKSERQGSKWSTPVELTMNQGVPFEYHPVLSPDNDKLFFNSGVSVGMNSKLYLSMNNLWYCDKLPNGLWSSPKIIQPLVTSSHDDYASILHDGTIYFRSDREGGKGFGDIYASRLKDGEYMPPENVDELNSSQNENDVCLDPNGRFVIFNRYHVMGRLANLALYVSLRTQTGWTKPRKIEHLDRSYDFELTPTLSPDGKYFYYEVNANILRVETSSLFTPEELELLKH